MLARLRFNRSDKHHEAKLARREAEGMACTAGGCRLHDQLDIGHLMFASLSAARPAATAARSGRQQDAAAEELDGFMRCGGLCVRGAAEQCRGLAAATHEQPRRLKQRHLSR